MNKGYYLEHVRTPETNIRSWGRALRPDVPEAAVPSISLQRPDLFPLPDKGVLDFSDVDTFTHNHVVDYLRAVHAQRLSEQFPSLADGHCDSRGNFYTSIFDDPRIRFIPVQDVRHQIAGADIGVAQVNDVLTLHYPGVTLAPSLVAYTLGQATARLAENIRDRRGEVVVFEMGVGGGIIMASTLKNFQGKGLFYIGGDIDERCLCATDTAMQMNGFDPESYRLRKGSILKPVKSIGVDIIVSNPPYYPKKEAVRLSQVGPNIAIDGGDDGLDFYKAILEDSKAIINPSGKILLQVSNVNLGAVRALAEDSFGRLAKVSVIRAHGKQVFQPTNKGKGVLVELR